MRMPIFPTTRISSCSRQLQSRKRRSQISFRLSRRSWLQCKPQYLQAPKTAEQWERIAREFWRRWNCPKTLGCIDGKHVQIKKPANSGSLFFNYKGTFSIVLMAICDSKYRIIYADIGCFGHESDGGIFDRCDFNSALKDGSLALPKPGIVSVRQWPRTAIVQAQEKCDPTISSSGRPGPVSYFSAICLHYTMLPNSEVLSPFFFTGGATFPLITNLMKPLPATELTDEKRIYNYRICRGRRVMENTFGIMSAIWRILLKPIETSDKVADSIIKACCALHNFLIDEGSLNAGAMADTGLGNELNGN